MRKTSMVVATVASLAAVACGSSPSPFLGVWQVSGGAQTLVCNGQSSSSNVTGSFTIVAGSSSSDLKVLSPNGCQEDFNVNNGDATATQQTCVTQQNGEAASVTFSTDELTLSGDTLTELGNGTIDVVGADAGCAFTQALTATKAAGQ